MDTDRSIIVLYGESPVRLAAREHEIIAALLPNGADRLTHVVAVDVEEQGFARVLEELEMGSFFAGPKIVVARRALFLSAPVTGRGASGNKEADRALLASFLDAPAPRDAKLLIVVPAAKLDGRAKVVKALLSVAAVEEIRPRTDAERRRWIASSLRARGLQVADEVIDDLAFRLPKDDDRAQLELDKWMLYVEAAGAPPDEETLEWLLTQETEASAFALLDAVFTQNAALADTILKRLYAAGEEPLKLLGLLASQLRLMLIAREAGRVPPETLAKELGVHPFAVKMARKRAAGLAPEVLAERIKRVATLDQQAKSGRIDKAEALELALLMFWINHRQG
ncbi:MAG: DNA polymerase III subunit delta [Hydrogenibacillus sp.]|nr:DNA polymerase III subunit delta [Hydrogenibacillus sp.]